MKYAWIAGLMLLVAAVSCSPADIANILNGSSASDSAGTSSVAAGSSVSTAVSSASSAASSASSAASSSSSGHAAYYTNNEARLYFQGADTASDSVKVAILGDGYTTNELATNGVFDLEAKRVIDYIFYKPPFQQYTNLIKVWFVYAASAESNADTNYLTNEVNTVFDATFGYYGIERLLVVRSNAAVYQYLSRAGVTADIILISVNSTIYGGSGGTFAVASRHSLSPEILLHELGHSFGWLADEYVDLSITNTYPLSGIGAYWNVDTNSNLATIKWSNIVGQPGYTMVGAYEGGYYRDKDVWRPQNDCMMRGYTSGQFCHVCRNELTKKIMAAAGRTYSFTNFLSNNPLAVPPEGVGPMRAAAQDWPMIPDDLRRYSFPR